VIQDTTKTQFEKRAFMMYSLII